MKILTRSRVLDISSTIAALMHTNNELLDEGTAAGINLDWLCLPTRSACCMLCRGC